ncbi:MAG: AI-2E family transporter [Muribaculaceae bacterium]|nr:AI-2E family transporter [Muribaculaceae bacterium]
MDTAESIPRRPFTFDRVVRIMFTILTVLGIIYVLDALKGVLLPFLVACLIAYMLEPVVKWNMRITHISRRFIPVMLTLLEAIAVVTVAAVIFMPYLVSEATQMATMIRHYATTQFQIPYISDSLHAFIRDNIDFNEIARMLSREEWKALIKSTLSSSWNFLSSSLAVLFGILSWLIVILYVIFIMIDYDRIMLGFKHLVPARHRHRTFRVFDDIKNAMDRYFRGQFLIAMIVGVLFSIGFLIIGLPMSVILGLFIGVLNLVPYLQIISIPITALLCLVAASTGADFWIIFGESMLVYLIVQCIQDLILTPRIMGKAMGLNPAIILLSISIWGSILGFMGLIIALPLTTLILSYYDMYVVKRSRHHHRSITTKH